MRVYTLNLRVFWPLFTCLLTLLLLLHHLVPWDTEQRDAGCNDPPPALGPLFKFLLPFALCCLFISYCAPHPGPAKRGGPEALGKAGGAPRRELLDDLYEKHVHLSPHVLGHSKAHVAKLVGELVRAGRAEAPPESTLAFRGDFVQIGSSYEEHKVGEPDCFDILVPVRLPRGLGQEPRVWAKGIGGPPLFTLDTPRRSEWTRRHQPFTEAFLRLHPGGPAVYRLSSDAVLRWFHAAVQRCLATVRYPFEQRCMLSMSVGEGHRLQLRLTPRSDYVCCHLSMGVRLLPALPLPDGGAFLVPEASGGTAAPRGGEGVWTVFFPRHEQRLLGSLKSRLPHSSCHLRCLQLLKEVRDLGGQALDPQGGAEWKGVLSSYALKTAWMQLLLSSPPEAWEERHLVARLEELLRNLRESLQGRVLPHLLLGGDGKLLPDSVALPKLVKETKPSNLWAGHSPETLDLVSARLAYTWTHLSRLIRLGRPQRGRSGRGGHCTHTDLE